jgi:TPR repeat protein
MQSRLARSDNDGLLSEDSPEAIERARNAAQQGDPTAQNSLGLRFASGHGVPRSDAEAVKWFRRAAQQGLAEAQFNLGNLVYSASVSCLPIKVGDGRIEAYMWFRLAAAQGHLRAGAFEETVNLQLTDAELHEGNRRAHAFQPRDELSGDLEISDMKP